MDPPAGQSPEKETIDSPEREPAAGCEVASAVYVVQDPRDLRPREVRIEAQASLLPHSLFGVGVFQRRAAISRAAILPDDRPVTRHTGALVPQHDGLALIGDADCGDGLIERGRQLGERAEDRLPDLFGVVLDPTRLGEVLGEFPIGETERRAGLVDGERAHAGGAGVDADHDSHGRRR